MNFLAIPVCPARFALLTALLGSCARAGVGGASAPADAGGMTVSDSTAEAPPACAPAGGGPYWVEEGATVSAGIACSTGASLPGDAFSFTGLPAGAAYDPATATLTWKTSLSDAGVYLIEVAAAGETGKVKIGVADKFDDAQNVAIKDRATYTEEMGLPVIHLEVTPQLDANLKRLQDAVDFKGAYPCGPDATTPATAENGFCADHDSPIRITYRGHTYEGEGRYRGWSSLWYAPKKLNYVLKFPTGDRFNEPVLAGGKMTGRHKIDLVTTIDDNSYVRWRMAFELWKRLYPDRGIHIQNFSAVVYVWDQAGKPDYRGVYTVADRPDEDFFHSAGLANGSDVYMAVDHIGTMDVLAPDMSVTPPGVKERRCYFQGFEKRNGPVDQCDGTMFVPAAYEGLKPLLDFVSTASDAAFRADFDSRLDFGDFSTWFILAGAAATGDSYSKNAIYTHDPVGGGRWRVVVWDFNDSFGQDSHTFRSDRPAVPDAKNFWVDPKILVGAASTPGVGQAAYNNVMRRLWNDAVYGPRLRQRYASAIRSEISAANMLALFDALVTETQPAARRDERILKDLYRTFWTQGYWGDKRPTAGSSVDIIRNYVQELGYVRKWITDRWAYLQTVFPP